MPENLDPSSLTPDPTVSTDAEANAAVVEEPAAEAPAEPAEKYVPLSELIDERHARQQAQAQIQNLTQQAILLQQQILDIKKQADPTGLKRDPQIEEMLKPYLQPYEAELEAVKAAAGQARAALELQQKMDYVRTNLPAFDELGPLIAKEIQQMDPAEQDAILSNPRLIVKLGKAIEVENKTARAAAVKQVARAAGRTETGSASVAASADTVSAEKDWMSMSSEEFNAHPLAKLI